ncbi:MAG: flocculation-associated PEP-CTERM protein PepA [Thiobacillus sp.]
MNFKIKALQGALVAAMAVASVSASAAVFNDFQVTEQSVPGSLNNVFIADKITGNYVEIVTFTPTSATSGTFDTSIKWNAGQFVANDGTTPVATQLGSFGGNGYGLYALLMGSGTYTTSGVVTTFSFNSGGTLSVWIDPDQNTSFAAPATGNLAWTLGNTGDDYQIASGALNGGFGTLDPGLPTCVGGINCGSFGTSTSFLLTALGSQYFTSPVPFYNASFESGQLNSFTVAGTQSINGSLDVVFAKVPEPSSIALLGLGLLGLGMGLRRRKVD